MRPCCCTQRVQAVIDCSGTAGKEQRASEQAHHRSAAACPAGGSAGSGGATALPGRLPTSSWHCATCWHIDLGRGFVLGLHQVAVGRAAGSRAGRVAVPLQALALATRRRRCAPHSPRQAKMAYRQLHHSAAPWRLPAAPVNAHKNALGRHGDISHGLARLLLHREAAYLRDMPSRWPPPQRALHRACKARLQQGPGVPRAP